MKISPPLSTYILTCFSIGIRTSENMSPSLYILTCFSIGIKTSENMSPSLYILTCFSIGIRTSEKYSSGQLMIKFFRNIRLIALKHIFLNIVLFPCLPFSKVIEEKKSDSYQIDHKDVIIFKLFTLVSLLTLMLINKAAEHQHKK